MVIVIGKPDTIQCVQDLNFRHEFEIKALNERSQSQLKQSVAQNSEQITHLVYDMAMFANMDTSIELIERFSITLHSARLIVRATEACQPDTAIYRDLTEVVDSRYIAFDESTLKRILNQSLCEGGIIKDDADEIVDVQEPSGTIREDVVPPTQISRLELKESVVLPKPQMQRSSTSVAVAGAGHRIGTTTQAMQLLLYLRTLGYKVAIIEMTEGNLSDYCYVYEGIVEFGDTHCMIEGVDIYSDKAAIIEAKNQYDYLVLDYGDFNELPDKADFLRNDILVAVAGVKPGEIECVRDVLKLDNGTINYIFSFVPQNDRQDVVEQMEQSGVRTHFAEWTPDYFVYCGNDNLYGVITGQKEVEQQAVQKKKGIALPWRKRR